MSKKLVQIVLATGVSLIIGLGVGYQLGKYYNEPISVENLNLEKDGPKCLLIRNRKIMGHYDFMEQENGSFKKEYP